ncbi:hypothetical protein FGF1_03240 [Flavobacteriaceae bacterium GF1]
MEIGHKAYAEALEEQGLNRQPPISMRGFYIEYNVKTKEEDIWYTYPSGVSFKIISLLGYFTPKEGWEKVWDQE